MTVRQDGTSGDPLAGSSWSQPGTVSGFLQSPPNDVLMSVATAALSRAGGRLLDIGCGAARNAVPLAHAGWRVTGVDLSRPMAAAAMARARDERVADRVHVALAGMHPLPFADRCFDFVVAHGIWNLARSGDEFRRGVAEAARVARPGAALFVFTFSRRTLAPGVQPVEGESFVFTEFSGQPQCFLSGEELVSELGAAGFSPDLLLPLRELNLPRPGALRTSGPPVIYEGLFRRHE